MWLKDVRPEVTLEDPRDKVYGKPLFELNVSNKLNIGLFESVIWTNTNDRGLMPVLSIQLYFIDLWSLLHSQNWKCIVRFLL
jgi:hypothetical protein